MIPVIAIVGRPNVGKSTLFNCLTKSRDALVADEPGVTRDRKYGEGTVEQRKYIVIDTGGLADDKEGIKLKMSDQVEQAINDADSIIFMVDGKAELTSGDEAIALQLRKVQKPIFLAVNKTDGKDPDIAKAEFYGLGIAEVFAIAAAHRRGTHQLIQHILADMPEQEAVEEEKYSGIKVAIVGKPNVGKSTLVNRMLGEERVVVFDEPGTTRDSIYIPFTRRGQDFTLIDTAGVRRRGRIKEVIEKFSTIKTLRAVEAANVVVFLVDARESLSEQDLRLLGFVLDAGKSLLIGVNKWDGLTADQRERVTKDLDRRLRFVNFAKRINISALHGTGVGHVFTAVIKAHESAMKRFTTPHLNKILQQAVSEHQPPMVKGRRIKLRYAHLGGHNPPIVVIHGNQVASLPAAYKRFLSNKYREELGLVGTPVRIELRSGENPFEGKKNVLTERQHRRKKRLFKHVKKS